MTEKREQRVRAASLPDHFQLTTVNVSNNIPREKLEEQTPCLDHKLNYNGRMKRWWIPDETFKKAMAHV